MATPSQTIAAAIAGASSITALVGTRYWPDVAPDDAALPRITWQVISQIRNDWLAGPGVGQRVRIQVNCWSAKSAGRAGADTLGDTVEAVLKLTGHILFRQSTYDPEAQIYWTQLDWSVAIASP